MLCCHVLSCPVLSFAGCLAATGLVLFDTGCDCFRCRLLACRHSISSRTPPPPPLLWERSRTPGELCVSRRRLARGALQAELHPASNSCCTLCTGRFRRGHSAHSWAQAAAGRAPCWTSSPGGRTTAAAEGKSCSRAAPSPIGRSGMFRGVLMSRARNEAEAVGRVCQRVQGQRQSSDRPVRDG